MADSKLVTYERYTKHCSNGRTLNGKTYTVDTITIHCTAGNANSTAKNTVDFFATTPNESGSTYCVGGDGSIGQSTLEVNRPWTSGGEKNVNGETGRINDYHAITIEVASDRNGTYVTDKAITALINLVVDICKRYGKTKAVWFGDDAKKMVAYTPQSNEMKFTWHRWFASKACPGPYLMANFQDIIDKVNEQLNPTVSTVPEKPDNSSRAHEIMAQISALLDELNKLI